MLGPTDVLIDDIAGDAPVTISPGNAVCQFLVGQKTSALCEAEGPFRWHYRIACKVFIMSDYLLEILPEDEIIYHLPVRHFKAVPVAAFGPELELGLVSIVEEYAVAVVAHEERDAFIERILNRAVTRLVAVPHLVLLAPAVELTGLFSEAEEMFVTPENLVFNLPRTVNDPSPVGAVAEKEFLIFVLDFQTQGFLVNADPELVSKYLITCFLLAHGHV